MPKDASLAVARHDEPKLMKGDVMPAVKNDFRIFARSEYLPVSEANQSPELADCQTFLVKKKGQIVLGVAWNEDHDGLYRRFTEETEETEVDEHDFVFLPGPATWRAMTKNHPRDEDRFSGPSH